MKKMWITLVAMLMVFTVAACSSNNGNNGSSGNKGTVPSPADEAKATETAKEDKNAEPVTLKFLQRWQIAPMEPGKLNKPSLIATSQKIRM